MPLPSVSAIDQRSVATSAANSAWPVSPDIVFGVFEGLQTPAVVLDSVGHIILVNEAWRQFTRETRCYEQRLGVGCQYLDVVKNAAFCDDGNAFDLRTALRAVLRGASSGFSAEYVLRNANAHRFLSVHGAPYACSSGAGAIITHADITGRKLPMVELETERQILREVAEDAPLGRTLAMISQALQNLLCGSACAVAAIAPEISAFHLVAGAPRAARIFDAIASLSPETRGLILGEACAHEELVDLATLAETIENGRSPIARELASSSGTLLTIHGHDGALIGLGVVLERSLFSLSAFECGLMHRMRAVTRIAILAHNNQAALQESEERYSLAFEGANDGLWDWDLRRNRVLRSSRCLQMLGYQPESKFVTETHDWWTQRIHPDDAGMALADLNKCLEGGEQSFGVDYRMLRADGSFCWVFDRGVVMRDSAGRPYRAAGSVTDISERKLAEARRHELEKQVRQIQKSEALGTLAGGVAHDINNTLVPIFGSVDLLLQGVSEQKEVVDTLQDILAAAEKVRDLVRQILVFSRREKAAVKTWTSWRSRARLHEC